SVEENISFSTEIGKDISEIFNSLDSISLDSLEFSDLLESSETRTQNFESKTESKDSQIGKEEFELEVSDFQVDRMEDVQEGLQESLQKSLQENLQMDLSQELEESSKQFEEYLTQFEESSIQLVEEGKKQDFSGQDISQDLEIFAKEDFSKEEIGIEKSLEKETKDSISSLDEVVAILEERQKIMESNVDFDIDIPSIENLDIDLSNLDLSDIDLSNLDTSDIDLSNFSELEFGNLSEEKEEKLTTEKLIDKIKEEEIKDHETKEDKIEKYEIKEEHKEDFVYNENLKYKIDEILKVFSTKDVQKILYLEDKNYYNYQAFKKEELSFLNLIKESDLENIYFEIGKAFGFILKESSKVLLIVFNEGVVVGTVKLKIKNIKI
ncbi:MAG: hypothetical protein ACK4GR_04230, partial [bacterium]